MWTSEPWIRGAYGAAKPGKAHLRVDLATPVADQLFFAGEATSTDWFSTVNGAHLSGVAAVEAVAEAREYGGVPFSGVGMTSRG
jgi:monoamine oxidase